MKITSKFNKRFRDTKIDESMGTIAVIERGKYIKRWIPVFTGMTGFRSVPQCYESCYHNDQKNDQQNDQKNDQGFTLLEVLIVAVIVAILAAIGIPSWISLVNRTKINNARSEVFQTIREAQSKAKQKKVNFEASFQNATNSNGQAVIQWAVNSADSDPNWQSITIEGVEIDTENTKLSETDPLSIQFDERGEVDGYSPPVKITVVNSNNTAAKRCVWVRSLLGVMNTADDDECEREN